MELQVISIPIMLALVAKARESNYNVEGKTRFVREHLTLSVI